MLRRDALPLPVTSAIDTTVVRRRALWVLLAAKLVGGWGLGWDIRWHLVVGRDSFWIAPHLMTYAAVAVVALVSFGVLLLDTWTAPRPRRGMVAVLGLVGTRGYHLAWWGIALTILAAPIDDLWHRLFGLDVTLWSPPHLLGLAGAQVNSVAVLLIALECWPRSTPARSLALAVGGVLLLNAFEVMVDPAVQTAYRHGGVLFFTWPILGGLAFAATLVCVSRLWPVRASPVIVAAGAVLMQMSVLVIADAGFALLRPASAIAEAIAADPRSPIALAHEMARLSGGVPGRSLTLRLFTLLPAIALALVDARRRWSAASLAFGATLFAVAGVMLARSPALQHALPSAADIAVGALLTLLATLAGGAAGAWMAGRLADLAAPGSRADRR